MLEQRFKLQISLNYAVIPENVVFERVLALIVIELNWSHGTNVPANLIVTSIQTWLAKDYRSLGVILVADKHQVMHKIKPMR